MDNFSIIEKHLGENSEGFLYDLYEKRYFDVKKFNELIKAIKGLHNNKVEDIINYKCNDCVGNNFLANLIQRFWLLLNIEGDIREYPESLNIDSTDYSDYMDELSYELQSLFAGWDRDYNGKKYLK